MSKRTSNAAYLKQRALILADNPLCHWCQTNPATEADHLVEHDLIGETGGIENLVPACKPCNARRGQAYKQAKQRARLAARPTNPDRELFLQPTLPPTPLKGESLFGGEPAGTGPDQREVQTVGSELPRLETRGSGVGSYAPLVQAWAKTYLQVDLMPWQVHALEGQLLHDANGDFVHREALTSTARQNGKSVALQALIGFALCELPKIWGRPVNILSVANMLDRAEGIHATLAPILKEVFGAKTGMVVGRKYARLGMSQWDVRAASTRLHGGSYDLVVIDELFDVNAAALDEAIRPTMIARRSPLLSAWSTAGDQSSTAMIKMREEALDAIDAGVNHGTYFAEWSADPGRTDPGSWHMANPALGRTITIKALEAASKKDYFLRAHLNQWVTVRHGWLDATIWDSCAADIELPDGPAVLAVETSLDESRYVGILAAKIEEQVYVKVAFICESENAMWHKVEELMTRKQMTLLVTPTFEIHVPRVLQPRTKMVGYTELIRYTGLIQKMILEGRVRHDGSTQLAEHMLRAVMVKTATGTVLSSKKSPGPIELARCAVWAIAEVSRPGSRQKPMLVVSG